MAMRLIWAAILILAITRVSAGQIEPAAIHFGWVVSDSSIFAEIPQAMDNDDYLARFGENFDPESFDETYGTVMCNYGRIDSIPEIQPALAPGTPLLVVVNGSLRKGVMDSYAYTRNPTTGYFFPGYHIELEENEGFLPCMDTECSYYCTPALVIAMSDSLAAATNVFAVEKLDSPSAPPAMVKYADGIDLRYQAGPNDLCESQFNKISGDNLYIVGRVCRPEAAALRSRYFGAREAGGIFEFSEIDFAEAGPVGSLDFISLIEIAKTRYLYARNYGHESVNQILSRITGGRLEEVSTSSTFGD